MKKIIIFDVDGTMADTKNGIIFAINEVLEKSGLPTLSNSDYDKYIGPPIKSSFITYQNMPNQKAEACTQLYRKLYVEKYIEQTVLYEGTVDVFEYLEQHNYYMCIATMKTFPQMERLFQLFDIEKYFDLVKTADEQGMKNKAILVNEILDYFKVKEKQSIYLVGDTESDYKAAKENNVNFVAADYGYGRIDRDDCVHIQSIRQLIHILNGEN